MFKLILGDVLLSVAILVMIPSGIIALPLVILALRIVMGKRFRGYINKLVSTNKHIAEEEVTLSVIYDDSTKDGE